MAQDIFRQEYRTITEAQSSTVLEVKQKAQELHDIITRFESGGTAPREIALFKTYLETAVMWAVKGITS